MPVTIKDVAERANVCIATVSRAFNNPDCVSEKRRKAIFEAAAELNYQPNALARGLIKKYTNSIGVVVPDIDNIFFPGVVQGIQDGCAELGYLSYVCNTNSNIEREKCYIETLRQQRIGGFLFVGTRPTDSAGNAHLFDLVKNDNVLLLFDDLPDDRFCAVYTDEVAGSMEAVRYLYHQGHRRIALFNSDIPYTTYRYKQRGYEKALAELGLPLREDYIFFGPPYAAGGYQCMEQMFARFSSEERPTAVFTISDQVALGVCSFCRDHGLRRPVDLSLVGFSGTKLVGEYGERFPTIDQQPYKIGRLAAETLIHNIEGDRPRERRIIFDSPLRIPD